MYELRDKRSKNGAVLRLEIMHALTEMAELFLNHAKSIPFYKILTNLYLTLRLMLKILDIIH